MSLTALSSRTLRIAVLTGGLNRPSRTRALAELIASRVAAQRPSRVQVVDIADLAPALGSVAYDPAPPAVAAAHDVLAEADLLVVASPVYNGSYGGLFKHFLDLLAPTRLAGKVAILAATGGSDRHALAIEHQLRPLLSFFELHTVPAGVYARDAEFEGTALADPAGPLARRVELAVGQALDLLPLPSPLADLAAATGAGAPSANASNLAVVA